MYNIIYKLALHNNIINKMIDLNSSTSGKKYFNALFIIENKGIKYNESVVHSLRDGYIVPNFVDSQFGCYQPLFVNPKCTLYPHRQMGKIKIVVKITL